MNAPPDDRARILDELTAIARQHLEWTGELRWDTPLVEALSLDSLRLLTLVVEVENRFRICLDEGDEEGLETAGDLVEAVLRHLADPEHEDDPDDAG